MKYFPSKAQKSYGESNDFWLSDDFGSLQSSDKSDFFDLSESANDLSPSPLQKLKLS